MKLFLYNLWIFTTAADAFAAALAGLYLKQLHNKLGDRLAWAFFGVSLEALRTVLVVAVAPDSVTPVIWVIVTAMAVRGIKAALMTWLVLYLYHRQQRIIEKEGPTA